MKAYIKFRHPDAVYLLDSLYDLREMVPPKTCGKCGENLHIPVDGDFELALNISRSMGDVIFKREVGGGLVAQSFPCEEEIVITRHLGKLSWIERDNLRHMGYAGLLMVENEYIELSVHDVSKEPVRCTVCFPKEEPNLCEVA